MSLSFLRRYKSIFITKQTKKVLSPTTTTNQTLLTQIFYITIRIVFFHFLKARHNFRSHDFTGKTTFTQTAKRRCCIETYLYSVVDDCFCCCFRNAHTHIEYVHLQHDQRKERVQWEEVVHVLCRCPRLVPKEKWL